MIQSLRLSAASCLVALLVAACGSSAAPSPTPATPTQQVTDTSGLGGLGGLLGGALHGNAALEARLPSQVCGANAVKMSVASGALPASALSALGGGASLLSGISGSATFSFALAAPGAAASSGCSTGFFALQVSGGDANNLLQLMATDNTSSGGSSSQTSLGGKNVTVLTDSGGSKTYVYVSGDTLFAVEAPDDSTAGQDLSQLP
jgi:hypothetical protein